MSPLQSMIKRAFDILGATFGLLLLWPLILLACYFANRDTGEGGLFFQERIGRYGRRFRIVKIRTMRTEAGTTVTTLNDTRITELGMKLRRWKIDELPQLWNILVGDMSFVGPRPDVPGFSDRLEGSERLLLQIRPGVTGPATLKYRTEEMILASVDDPNTYNRYVIWPDKVRINLEYIENWSFFGDLSLIWQTLIKR